MGWLLMLVDLRRRQAHFVAVVAVLDRGKVGEAMWLGWSPDRIHASMLIGICEVISVIYTPKNTPKKS
ncbi:hypothetical protein [Burkholderia cepacia]|uniref:hypothetical protein n=1 Tax=Burkholderia cepacia TaxID=292 RepID=UPI0012D92E31|nr:hypothetical protein [Burkholderia cepacia]